MIELRNVSKAYPVQNGLRHVLRDVSFIIPDHAHVAVLGPNGAGKSTFLRLIGGAEDADSGEIITDSDISWPLGLNSGFQGSLTGRENLLFVCRINGLDIHASRHVINQVISFAEIGEYMDMPVATYSSGMRARLSFGLSMCFKFDFYLIDELTSVGDMVFRQKAKLAFNQIRKSASLIFVSHNLNALRQSCDSALFLRDGQADFFPSIEEGIDVYAEYVATNKTPKGADEIRRAERKAERRAQRKADRKAARKFERLANSKTEKSQELL